MNDTPDPRPAGETAHAILGQIRSQVCCCEDGADGPVELIAANRAEMDRLLDAYRDACKAEARAALLAGAPVVYVATDADGVSHLHHKAPRWDKAGELWWSAGREPLSREIAMDLLGVAAGECAAFRLARRAA